MIERYIQMVDRWPVWLIEDGLAESDWDGWQRLTAKLGERVRLVGAGCGLIKSGAPARGERVAKYNRLMEIEAVEALPYGIA